MRYHRIGKIGKFWLLRGAVSYRPNHLSGKVMNILIQYEEIKNAESSLIFPEQRRGSMFNVRTFLIYIKNNIASSLLIPNKLDFYYDGKLIPIGAQLSYAQNIGVINTYHTTLVLTHRSLG
jgi:hypothetical protein